MQDLQQYNFYFRHEKMREHQDEMIKDVYNAISNKKNLLAHAPVGLGKTDAVFSATLNYAIENNLTIFFLTPKISQHKIAIDVVRGIAKKFDLKIRAVDMIGRRYACIDPSLKDLDHESFYQSCEKKRRNEECLFYANARGYNKLQEVKANHLFSKILKDIEVAKTSSEIIDLGEKNFACPYEWLLKLAAMSNIVIADYYHIMIPRIRDVFLKKINKRMDKSIIIIDEAHNLAKRVRDQLSSTVNSFILRRAEKEIGFLSSDKILLEREFKRWAVSKLGTNKELLVTRETLEDFLSAYDIPRDEMQAYFENIGAEFIEKTNRKSACLKIAKFLADWQTEEKSTIRILRKRGEYFSLSKKFLDPSIATEALNDAHSTILISGTLLPLEMHRDVLGLYPDKTILKKYGSPFDEKNTINIISDQDTTKFSKRTFENYVAMAQRIDRIILSSPSGVAIFFPSYVVLNSIVQLMKTKNLIVQREKLNPIEVGTMLRDFSDSKKTLCAVQGGSLAEGVDYANNEIKTAIIVGIALEEPTIEVKSLIDYYQDKFNKGWEYGYTYPALTKALQSAGRAIRKETDRAAIVFMDERFKWDNYRRVVDSNKKFIITKDPEKYVKEFWQIK